MYALNIFIMTASLNITSSVISGFETKELCQQAQAFIGQQMMHFAPQPQFQTICVPTKKVVGEEIR